MGRHQNTDTLRKSRTNEAKAKLQRFMLEREAGVGRKSTA